MAMHDDPTTYRDAAAAREARERAGIDERDRLSARARVAELERQLAAAQAENAALREALDTMRDEILHADGPMEVNDVLAIIDYNDPRDAAALAATSSAPECRECERCDGGGIVLDSTKSSIACPACDGTGNATEDTPCND